MAQFETRPGNGSIFKNNKKEKETHPDYNGKIKDPTGKDWDLSLWIKKSASGISYFSVSIKEPYIKPEQLEPQQQVRPFNNESYFTTHESGNAVSKLTVIEEQPIIDDLPF